MSVNLILLIIALILAILAAVGVNARGGNLLAASFAVYLLSLII